MIEDPTMRIKERNLYRCAVAFLNYIYIVAKDEEQAYERTVEWCVKNGWRTDGIAVELYDWTPKKLEDCAEDLIEYRKAAYYWRWQAEQAKKANESMRHKLATIQSLVNTR